MLANTRGRFADQLSEDDRNIENRENNERLNFLGMPRASAIFFFALAVIGVAASFELVVAELTIAANPHASLGCDLNPLVGCSSIVVLPVSHIFFGIPNALLGIMAFSAIAMLGLVIAIGTRIPRSIWFIAAIGMVFASGYVLFFQWYSFYVKNSLCPWCFVTWLVTVPAAIFVWGKACEAWLASKSRLKMFVWKNRWVFSTLWWVITVIAVLVHWWDRWLAVL